MIKTEYITINNRELIRTYSDSGKYIQRDGVRYAEAIDPIDSGRTYEETDIDIPYFDDSGAADETDIPKSKTNEGK